jgi:hypothetical protein
MEPEVFSSFVRWRSSVYWVPVGSQVHVDSCEWNQLGPQYSQYISSILVKTSTCFEPLQFHRQDYLCDTSYTEYCAPSCFHFQEYIEMRVPLMVAQWLRYCATNRKIAGSIPDGVIGIFHWHNPSDRIMALGSTQALKEMCRCHVIWEP